MIKMTNLWLQTHKNYIVKDEACEQQTRPQSKRKKKQQKKNPHQNIKFILFLFSLDMNKRQENEVHTLSCLVVRVLATRTARIYQTFRGDFYLLSFVFFFLLLFFGNEIMCVCQLEHDVNYSERQEASHFGADVVAVQIIRCEKSVIYSFGAVCSLCYARAAFFFSQLLVFLVRYKQHAFES